MALSIKLIQHLREEENSKSKHSKESGSNINSTIDWDKDLIYRWISNACANCNNQECSLQHILALENFQLESRSSYRVKEFVVKSFADVLSNIFSTNNALENETIIFFEKISHGCNFILSSIEMQQYFKSDLRKLNLLIKSFLIFESHILKTSNSIIKTIAQNSLTNVINYYLQIYKQFSNKELFAMSFLNEILFTFCNLTKFNNSTIDSELYRCIQTLLFAKIFLPQYKKFTNESEGIPKTLFSTLKEITNANLEISLTIFEVVLRVAVKSYESDTKVVDLIFRNMVESCGKEKMILKNLLDCLIGIHLNMDNEIENVTLSNFLMKCVNEIVTKTNLNSLDYELITKIININPFTVENNFEDILIKVVSKKSNVSESSYNNFFMAILNASISLRREHKLIIQLLMSTKNILSQNNDEEMIISLPEEFLTKFMDSISNITISQTTTILRSLIFQLKLCCVDISLPAFSKSASVMLGIIVELTIPFMKGIKIFDCVKNINIQKKFCRALVDLGNSFSSMTDRILKINCNMGIIFTFIKACQAWNDVCNLILYYVPNLPSEELETLFSTKKWLKLVAKVENSADKNSEKLGLELSQSLLINLIKKEKFIESVNCQSSFWISVARKNSIIISNLSNDQLSEISDVVIKDFSEESEKWTKIKSNARFISAMINQIIIKSDKYIKSEMTKQLLSKIVQDFKWKNVISKLKKGSLMRDDAEFSKNIKSKNCKLIKEYLNILSSMHLSYLNHDIRIVLFVLISSIHLEFLDDDQISQKSNEILLYLLQENDIDIFQFNNLQFLHLNPLQKEILSQIFELPLKNDSFNSLISFLDSNEISNEMVSVFLNTVQRIKFHRNPEENQKLKHLIEKWNNQLIKDENNLSTVNLVCLTISLKDAIVKKNVNDELKKTTNQILRDIFQNSNKNSKVNEECSQLLELVIRNRSYFEISNETTIMLSTTILHNPNENVLRPFLETIDHKEFTLFLKSLQNRTILGLEEENEFLLKNCLLIWEYIIKIEMGSVRNNLRLTSINNLLYTIEKMSISEKYWLYLLKLFETIVSSKFIQITGQNIDLILLSCMKCMKRVGIAACGEILSLYTVIVKLRTNFIKEKLSLLVLLNRDIIKLLSDEGKKLGNTNNQYQLECLILDLEKFVIALKKIGGNISEIYPYMLTDLIEWYCYHLLPKNLKNSIEIIVQHLLSHCEHETIEFLNRTLPIATQKIFKELVVMYRRHYKFTGKI